MPQVAHDSCIAWPNGRGETPCSKLYVETFDAHTEAEIAACRAEDDEDWAAYTEHLSRAEALRVQLEKLRDEGHVGTPVDYGTVLPVMALLGGATMTADGKIFNGDHFVGRL